MKVDHVFIRAGVGAPEADLLRVFGLSEGTGNRHPGQGTANRRFFFRNAFIELLWIADEREIVSESTRPTGLHERLSGTRGVSPFGICFRPSGSETPAPFPAWAYRPAYLPAGMSIDIGRDVPPSEPMWFFLSNGAPPVEAPPERRQALEHAAGLREITSLTVTMPGAEGGSAAALAAVESGAVSIREGGRHLIEIGFDHEVRGLAHDFRPALPLLFRY
ncbi:VOC family protein [Pseudoduganella namucuonensis]|uniref:Glyoxalase-like domain-containing protein n=1 Tax=Pseudoduganella namucuonensis TaxID=1035707 RepID=A0A1I7GWS4_9BURK|nr:VOC family protein [Pseudoduganella namucuonensis]SFU52855.1 Glyoxalase-like domain-containing protein [Pseudoduganella namucuonensis]